jgi:hypothetical protein
MVSMSLCTDHIFKINNPMTKELKDILDIPEEKLKSLEIIKLENIINKLCDFYNENKTELLNTIDLDKTDLFKEELSSLSIFEQEQKLASFTKELQKLIDIDETIDSKYYSILSIILEKKYQINQLKTKQ